MPEHETAVAITSQAAQNDVATYHISQKPFLDDPAYTLAGCKANKSPASPGHSFNTPERTFIAQEAGSCPHIHACNNLLLQHAAPYCCPPLRGSYGQLQAVAMAT